MRIVLAVTKEAHVHNGDVNIDATTTTSATHKQWQATFIGSGNTAEHVMDIL